MNKELVEKINKIASHDAEPDVFNRLITSKL